MPNTLTDKEKLDQIYSYIMSEGMFAGIGLKSDLEIHKGMIMDNRRDIKRTKDDLDTHKNNHYKLIGFATGIGILSGYFVKYVVDLFSKS